MKTLKHLTLTLDIPLLPHQIKKFRGAIIEKIGREHHLFHNHQDDGKYHYRYPLIQYKSQRRKAGMVGLGKGAEALYYLLTAGISHLKIDGREYPFQLAHLQQKDLLLQTVSYPKTYRLYNYIGLNSNNYEQWQQTKRYEDKMTILRKALTAHILSFAAGVGWDIKERFEVNIENINQTKKIVYKDTELMAFDIDFNVPLFLPKHIGLGKSVSMGFGKLLPLMKKDKGPVTGDKGRRTGDKKQIIMSDEEQVTRDEG